MATTYASECGNTKKEGDRTWKCQLPRQHKGTWHISYSGHRRWAVSKERRAEEAEELPPPSYLPHVILDGEDLRETVKSYEAFDYFVFDTETIGTREPREGSGKKDLPALDERTNRAIWIALSGPGRVDIIPMGHPSIEDNPAPEQLSLAEVLTELRPLFFSDRRKVAANVIFDTLTLAKHWGGIPPGPYGDLAVLVQLLDENLRDYDLGSIVTKYLGYGYRKLGREGAMDSFPFWDVARYVGYDAKLAHLVWISRQARLARYPKLQALFDLECDITEVLIHAKERGTMVDREALQTLDEHLEGELAKLSEDIYAAAGQKFLITSTQQRAKLLYGPPEEGGLGLKCSVFTNTGAKSTSEEALTKLVRKHPVVPLLVKHSDLSKLRSTYCSGFLPHIHPDGRIRGRLNQRGAATGRFTSSGPNLQNIPRQGDEDDAEKKIRSMFVAPPGYVLVVGDFGQVEYRVMGHFAAPFVKESRILRAFLDDIDLHAMTAGGLYNLDPSEVTKEQRQAGKTCNFLLMFGGGYTRIMESGLAREKTKAKGIYEQFHRTYPEVKKFTEATIRACRTMKTPYVETLWGRRRRLPMIKIPANNEEMAGHRMYAERQAVNHKIQGTAADINKSAMVRAHRRIDRYGYRGQMHIILTVHDEIIMEVPERLADDGVALLKEAMEGVKVDLRVPLVADVHAAETWADAK